MTLIAQAPTHISFGGGGTDLAAYYRRYGGIAVSAAINRYVYAIVSNGGSGSLQIISADYHRHPPSVRLSESSAKAAAMPVLSAAEGPPKRRTWESSLPAFRIVAANPISDGGPALPKAVLAYFGVKAGIDVCLASEAPAGMGLGASSSAAVSLVAALSAWLNRPMDRDEIAEVACHIEIDHVGMRVGKQDAYAAAFGGLNVFTFAEDGVGVEPIRLDPDTLMQLQESILLFYIGGPRDSSGIVEHQENGGDLDRPEGVQRLHRIKALSLEIRDALVDGDIRSFGHLMHQSWLNQRRLAADGDRSDVDAWYELARRAGAIGGTLIGAGGGYLMLVCGSQARAKVAEALAARGLHRMDFAFDFEGARVVSTETAPPISSRR